MKLSLSGVWKAYDMHTMNGQSWPGRRCHAEPAVPQQPASPPALCPYPLTPVLTRDNMMRSLRASVSPCFILMRFLSKHFMAYLGAESPCGVLLLPVPTTPVPQCLWPDSSFPQPSQRIPREGGAMATLWPSCMLIIKATPLIPLPTEPVSHHKQTSLAPLHFACVRFPAAVDLPKATAADDAMHTEVIHGELKRIRKRGSPRRSYPLCVLRGSHAQPQSPGTPLGPGPIFPPYIPRRKVSHGCSAPHSSTGRTV